MTASVIANPVAAALQEIRQRWGVSPQNLARMLGVSALYLRDVEHGRQPLTDQRIIGCTWTPLRRAMIAARITEYRERIKWLDVNLGGASEDAEIPPA